LLLLPGQSIARSSQTGDAPIVGEDGEAVTSEHCRRIMLCSTGASPYVMSGFDLSPLLAILLDTVAESFLVGLLAGH
jgi:hypothetical protein